MPFSVTHQDITGMHVDAIVNAANTDLMMGGGGMRRDFPRGGSEPHADRMQSPLPYPYR